MLTNDDILNYIENENIEIYKSKFQKGFYERYRVNFEQLTTHETFNIVKKLIKSHEKMLLNTLDNVMSEKGHKVLNLNEKFKRLKNLNREIDLNVEILLKNLKNFQKTANHIIKEYKKFHTEETVIMLFFEDTEINLENLSVIMSLKESSFNVIVNMLKDNNDDTE